MLVLGLSWEDSVFEQHEGGGMSIRYDTIRDGVIIFSFVMAFFFVNFLRV